MLSCVSFTPKYKFKVLGSRQHTVGWMETWYYLGNTCLAVWFILFYRFQGIKVEYIYPHGPDESRNF